MTYWIKKTGIPADRPFNKEELFSQYYELLTADTPCAKSGENMWGTIVNYFPDWQSLKLKQTEHPASSQTGDFDFDQKISRIIHLIKCPACDKEVSSQANSCPNCGQPIVIKPTFLEEIERRQKNFPNSWSAKFMVYPFSAFVAIFPALLTFVITTKNFGMTLGVILGIIAYFFFIKLIANGVLKLFEVVFK